MRLFKLLVISSVCALVFACASTPENADQVSDLRDRYEKMAADQKVRELAPVALQNAEDAVKNTEALVKSGADEAKIEKQMYLADRKLDILKQAVRKAEAEETISQAETMRKDILIDARSADAQKARMRADAAEQRAQSAEQRAQAMEMKAAKLQDEIAEITTKQTDRGLVLTLGDILFETGKSELLDGSQRSLKRVSEFLEEYSNRQIAVEGHTDSTGDASFNQQLSEKRATSVRDSLVRNGVDSSRVKTKGLGEEYPVASNDTREGRQQNRRVDIIIENATK